MTAEAAQAIPNGVTPCGPSRADLSDAGAVFAGDPPVAIRTGFLSFHDPEIHVKAVNFPGEISSRTVDLLLRDRYAVLRGQCVRSVGK